MSIETCNGEKPLSPRRRRATSTSTGACEGPKPLSPRGRGVGERGPSVPTPWFVYLIECADGSIYTGIATDVARRYAEHAAGRGARYTRSRPPRRLLAAFPQPDRSSALRAEHAIRRLPPVRKRALCAPEQTA